MYDWFVAPLRCPICSAVSPADSATNTETHLRDDARGVELSIGTHLDPIEVRSDDIVRSGYLPVHQPSPGNPIGILETWECPTCGAQENWAMVTLAGTEIVEIEAVSLNRTVLERAHFISDQSFILAARLSDVPGLQLVKGEVRCVEVLRRHLPES